MPGHTEQDPRQQPVILNKPRLYAVLVDEPFSLSLDKIQRLTDYQIFSIYLWPRTKDGDKVERSLDLKIREVLNIRQLKAEYYIQGSQMREPIERLDRNWRSAWPGWDV